MNRRILLIVLLMGCWFNTFAQAKIVKPKQARKTIATKSGSGQPNKTKTVLTGHMQTKTTSKPPQPKVITVKTLQGDNEDANHCPAGAGYVFSVLREGCVRLFDQPLQLLPLQPKKIYIASATVIFSDDLSRAEIFIPDTGSGIMLSREGNQRLWTGGALSLSQTGKVYVLSQGKTATYQSKLQ